MRNRSWGSVIGIAVIVIGLCVMTGYMSRVLNKVDNQDLYQKEAQRLQFEVNDFSQTAVRADSAKVLWLEATHRLGANAARPQLLAYIKLEARADSLRENYNRAIRHHEDSYFKEFELPRRLY